MNLDLRARAAVAEIGLFLAFNPHQRRGPDGRWIRMPDSELKRPRRPARGGVENPLYRRRREQYNTEVITDATYQREAFGDPSMFPQLDQIADLPQGRERDALVDQVVEQINQRAAPGEGYVPPTEGGPRLAPRREGTAERPGLDAPYARRRAALARSVRGGAVDERTLAQGVMGETRRFELADGTSAVYKKATRDWDRGWTRPLWTKKDQLDAEELSAHVAAALGVRAPAVHRAAEDELYMELMPGQEGMIKYPSRTVPGRIRRSQQGQRLGLLDVLIENTDRHVGNFLVDDEDNLYAIDHGLAFSNTYRMGEGGLVELAPVDRSRTVSQFADDFVLLGGEYAPDNPLTPADAQEVRARLARTRREFERLGHADWYDAMVRRLDRVAANASGDVDIF